MSTLVVEVLGWLGAGLLLLAYALVSRGVVAARSLRYQAMNVLGALLLALNSAVNGAWPSVGLNTVWLVVGVVAVTGALLGRTPRAVRVIDPGSTPG